MYVFLRKFGFSMVIVPIGTFVRGPKSNFCKVP